MILHGRPVLIPGAEGESICGMAFPSYVAITTEGQMLLGEPARRQAATNPEGTATAFKRRMGTRDRIPLRGKSFAPEQLSAFLLQKMKRDAEAFLGEPVDKAVVTIPACFDDNRATPPRTQRRDRSRRRHTRRDDHGVRQGSVRGQGDQRRHRSGRHRHAPETAGTGSRQVVELPGSGSAESPGRPPSYQQQS